MNLNRRYFDNLMQAKRLSLRGLAQKMGMSHSQLSLTFNGARKMQLDEASQLSNIFGEPLYRVVENAGVSVQPMAGKRVAVIGVVKGDGTVALHETGVVERVQAPLDMAADVVAVQCRTHGTPLEWMDTWLFFCRVETEVDPSCLGRFSLCRIHEGLSAVATVKRGYQEGTFNLFGPFTRENVILKSATPILLTKN